MHPRNNFDAVRLAAALTVFFVHMTALGGEPVWIAAHGYNWGEVAVFVFFAISGFLVMKSWRNDPDIGRFLAKRFLRIAPALAVVVPVTVLFVAATGLAGFPDNPRHALNGSLWTIQYEVYCYLLLLGGSLLFRHPAPIAAAVAIATIPLGYFDWLAVLGSFFIVGAALYEYPILRRWSLTIVALGVAAMPYNAMTLALIVAPVVVWIGSRSWPVLRDAGRFGDLSYGVYLWAYPVQQVTVALLGADAPYWTLVAASLPVILALAYLSWTFIESPAMGRKHALLARSVRPIPPPETAPSVASENSGAFE